MADEVLGTFFHGFRPSLSLSSTTYALPEIMDHNKHSPRYKTIKQMTLIDCHRKYPITIGGKRELLTLYIDA